MVSQRGLFGRLTSAEVNSKVVRAANAAAGSSIEVDSAQAREVGNAFYDSNGATLGPILTWDWIAEAAGLCYSDCQ
jgi:hypothetical protein